MGEGIGGEKKKNEKKGRENEEWKEDPKASSSDLLVFRRSEFVGPRVKVYLLNKDYAPRGRNSSYFGLFPPKGCLAVFSALRSCLAGFFIGMPCVDPAFFLQFGIGFQLVNIGNLGSCFS